MANWIITHRCGCLRSTQLLHLPHGGLQATTTWSPTARSVTPSPTAEMMPAPSWPGTNGAGCGSDALHGVEVGVADAGGLDLDGHLAGLGRHRPRCRRRSRASRHRCCAAAQRACVVLLRGPLGSGARATLVASGLPQTRTRSRFLLQSGAMGDLGFWRAGRSGPGDGWRWSVPTGRSAPPASCSPRANRAANGFRALGLQGGRHGRRAHAQLDRADRAVPRRPRRSASTSRPSTGTWSGPRWRTSSSDSDAKVFVAHERFAEVATQRRRPRPASRPRPRSPSAPIDGLPARRRADRRPARPPPPRAAPPVRPCTTRRAPPAAPRA